MRKILYSLIFCTLACWMASCDQDIDFAYEGKARIQFQHYTTDWNGNRHYADTLAITYGLLPDSITIDTAKVVIEFLGSPSDQAKTYYVSVVEDSTTAIAGTHYEPIAHEQTFRPNELTDTLRIVVYRSNLSNDYINPEDYQLYLQLEASPDFDLGLNGGLIKKIKLNEISKVRLEEMEMCRLLGGGTPGNCTCGCLYADSGGSSTASNDAANDAYGYSSYGYAGEGEEDKTQESLCGYDIYHLINPRCDIAPQSTTCFSQGNSCWS